ncbi:SufD family Fe-S cluster assembly protein [Cereibacter sphaeroides]|uniref:SufB/SufD family protein n=1 Tax=Cereibacter sphaeroides TaxID=1063 RepID=UPI001F308848|nr:SufD family Fe-S cluster assembly protein [Cereibacter sphaeroides]MCE6957841.1 SufD family Fe-S cluster assembly protein [Cereibacter sphaeroides]MCE6969545.1 SufD family Fe-S cluster assembly protein [Cereibacter sphaeroides]MCE6972697.1 SufD family Fe-S cluster assembly protein [Cereibacter sphaeroides]
MADALPKESALASRIAGLAFANEGWQAPARFDALSRLTAMGLPGRRDEYWRYTDPASFNAPQALPASTADDGEDAMLFEAIDRLKLVFVDGVFDAAASDPLALESVEIGLLGRSHSDIHWARDLYGVLEARGQVPVKRPFAALNTAFASEGVLIRVTGTAPKPIALIYIHRSETSDAMLHHCIRVEAGAEVTILENGPAAARFTKVMEVDVAERGRFHHIRAQGPDDERRAATHIFARVASEGLFKSFTLTANGVMTRNEAVLELVGDDAVAHVAGAAVGDGKFHHDDTVFITHEGQCCESRQVFKKVLKNGATGVFQGKILVKPGAQKTDGYQISQSLLLDEDSVFLAKPELEIYADDVKCSHGSTSGAIDETGLFYLRSRGVPLKAAQALLVLAFLAEAIQEIENEEIAEDIRLRLESWLARHEH